MSLSRTAPIIILVLSVGALAAALVSQYFFGLDPCVLCVYQRIPYVVAAVLAGLALVLPLDRRGKAVLMGLAGVAFAVNAGVAAFHVGVEQHWWAGTDACGGTPLGAFTLDDLKAAMARPAPTRCDEVPWSLFGVSMAGYNVVTCVMLAAFSWSAALRMRRQA